MNTSTIVVLIAVIAAVIPAIISIIKKRGGGGCGCGCDGCSRSGSCHRREE